MSARHSRDPSTIGPARYPRAALDFYPTLPPPVVAFLRRFEARFGSEALRVPAWEPFAGNGAISRLLAPVTDGLLSTDLRAYPGFDPDGLFDFFAIVEDEDYPAARKAWPREKREGLAAAAAARAAWERARDKAAATGAKFTAKEPPPFRRTVPVPISRVLAVNGGVRPRLIVSNPPYGDLTDKSVEQALRLLEPVGGTLALLMRHEWDAGSGRAHLTGSPAYLGKVVLRFRPRWIEGTTGAPRFPYAWFMWSHGKDPAADPIELFADRPRDVS